MSFSFDTLVLDLSMVLVSLALPVSSSSVLHSPAREYGRLWFRLPWMALLAFGCSGCVADAVRSSCMVPWLIQYAPRSAQYKFVTQILFTVGAALLTELVGQTATMSLMLPVVTEFVSAS
ncbi:hypothetical protein HPB48_009707 [Haemaphysalis longicornis]|uniref:Uncharacterized protein n=1 Tax=Haemaphysalis longicornis TaxID=44386 RepID=A0A9J6GCI0_HAELO|nr:hypothetical protein HPB48_009707 [Haemaphysalis longicornis]